MVVPVARAREAWSSGALEVAVRLLRPAQWPLLRDIRLRALRDAPFAFDSAHDVEAAWSEADWRATFESATWLVARDTHRAVALTRSAQEPGHPWLRNIESVWVEPVFRRRGIVRLLLATLTETERRAGVTELRAWVLDGNDGARRAWQRLGFAPTGERQALPGAGGRIEERLRLGIA